MWFATAGDVSQYDGKTFTHLTEQDGFANRHGCTIHRATDATMWFGTYGGGVSRYDGKTFTNFTTRDGLVSNDVRTIHRESDGKLWFGTWRSGISVYNGQGFTNLTRENGLASDVVTRIYTLAHWTHNPKIQGTNLSPQPYVNRAACQTS